MRHAVLLHGRPRVCGRSGDVDVQVSEVRTHRNEGGEVMIEIEWSKCSVLLFKAKSGSKSYPFRVKAAYVAVHPLGIVAVADPMVSPTAPTATCMMAWCESPGILELPTSRFLAEACSREIHMLTTPKVVKDLLRIEKHLKLKYTINPNK